MKTSNLRQSFFRVFRVMLATALILGAAAWLRAHTAFLRSEQAVINAEVLQVRTPISGQIEFAGLRPGTVLKKGDTLLRVTNSRYGDRTSAGQANSMHARVEELESEILGARYSVGMEESIVRQNEKLVSRGAIARQELTRAQARLEMAQRLVRAKSDQLAKARERAAETEEQSMLQKECVIRMPADGVIWSVKAKPGEQVEANHLLVEVLNPSNLWVDAFFSERDAEAIRPGVSVSIESLDGAGRWQGVLQTVRAGVGRFAVDSSVAVPPPEGVKRQIGVRIEAEGSLPFDASEFCGVGRSVLVSLDRAKPLPPVAVAVPASVSGDKVVAAP